jgi:hypothetical protein
MRAVAPDSKGQAARRLTNDRIGERGRIATTRSALMRGLMIGNDIPQVPMEEAETALVPFLVPSFIVPSSRLF